MKTILKEVKAEWLSIRVTRRLAIWTGLLGPFTLVLAFSMLVAPSDFNKESFSWFPHCAYKAITGVDCPTCGTTRAFCAFSHGQFSNGFVFNQAAIVPYSFFWIGSLAYLFILGSYVRAFLNRQGRYRPTAHINPEPPK
jgi:hypothetical protein